MKKIAFYSTAIIQLPSEIRGNADLRDDSCRRLRTNTAFPHHLRALKTAIIDSDKWRVAMLEGKRGGQ
jgi:hypothetical protein